MTKDACHRHPTAEATHVAMVATTTGRSVYRLCATCATNYPTATSLRPRVDVPRRASLSHPEHTLTQGASR